MGPDPSGPGEPTHVSLPHHGFLGSIAQTETGGRSISCHPGRRFQAFSPPATRSRHVTTYNILIMGASYGSLLATKLLFGGHKVKLVCLPAEAEAINKDGARVRIPIRGRKDPVEIDSRKLPGTLSADGPAAIKPTDYDLVGLAMQEPQYRSPGVRELLNAVAKAKLPCMSIMNMPPLPYLKRIPGLATD